jgi:hypothetical protein
MISRYSMDWSQVSLQMVCEPQQLGNADARRGLTLPMENKT